MIFSSELIRGLKYITGTVLLPCHWDSQKCTQYGCPRRKYCTHSTSLLYPSEYETLSHCVELSSMRSKSHYDSRAIIKMSGYQYWWLACGYDLEVGSFKKW